MTHIWVRAEERANEDRVGLTPQGAQALQAAGFAVTVEHSRARAIGIEGYRDAGCALALENSWHDAPGDAIIFGLKELPEDDSILSHRHVMFGHAYKGQPAGKRLLERFRRGGGALYDLEYLVDETGRRVAAFGYWAGYTGAAVALMCWAAQRRGQIAGPVHSYPSADTLLSDLQRDLTGISARPTALIIGALGRVGTGASDLCGAMDMPATLWDMAETASGGPFGQVLDHDIFLNCILARPGTPVFVPADTGSAERRLSVIGDIACDPDSDFSPIKVHDRVTTWQEPALRVHRQPPLDVTAIDNLPSMLPVEASQDFAQQLLPSLLTLDHLDRGIWRRAHETYLKHLGAL